MRRHLTASSCHGQERKYCNAWLERQMAGSEPVADENVQRPCINTDADALYPVFWSKPPSLRCRLSFCSYSDLLNRLWVNPQPLGQPQGFAGMRWSQFVVAELHRSKAEVWPSARYKFWASCMGCAVIFAGAFMHREFRLEAARSRMEDALPGWQSAQALMECLQYEDFESLRCHG